MISPPDSVVRTSKEPRRRKRGLVRLFMTTAVVGLLGLLGVNGCTSAWIAHAIADSPNKGREIRTQDDPSEAELARLEVDRQLRIQVGPPDASLSVWVIEPPAAKDPRGTVLVLHGIRDQKRTQLGLAKSLAEAGYRAVLVDLRGHGRSTGDWLTYGVVESRDLAQVLDALERESLLSGSVGVFGPSYGGAAALHLAALDDRVDCIVTVATFTCLREIVPEYLNRYWIGRLMLASSAERAIAESGRIADFNPSDADSLRAISATNAAVLLIHGKNDAHIPYQFSERLCEAGNGRCKLMLLDDEDHVSIYLDRNGVIIRETLAWFDAHLN